MKNNLTSMINKKLKIITLPLVLFFIVLFSFGCTSTEITNPYIVTNPSTLWQKSLNTYLYDSLETQTIETSLSFDYLPIDTKFYPNHKPEKHEYYKQVKPIKTRWGTPWDHKELCHNMNSILSKNGISSQNARIRMISHAIIASGWRQNIWNYNAWGVQQGSWSGLFYKMNTIEATPEGTFYLVKNAAWRSFSSWTEAVVDFQNRIQPHSRRPSYRQAYKHLYNSNNKADAAYWASLGDGNYYTTNEFTDKKFAILCREVRKILAQ